MKNKPYFPMFIDLSDKNIVVVGGGNIATRRVKTLLSFTRNIRVIAPKVTMEMMELSKAGYVELLTRPVKRSDFAMAYMVIAATNDRKLNDEIHRICRQEGIYVNVASDREQCDFYFPGIYMQQKWRTTACYLEIRYFPALSTKTSSSVVSRSEACPVRFSRYRIAS